MTTETLFDLGTLPEQPKPRAPAVPLSLADFVLEEDGERRIKDWRLSEVLDNRQLSKLRQLSEDHRPDLEDFGPLCAVRINSTGGRPGLEYKYNFEQAIFLINLSRAPNWKPVLKHVTKIYGMWARGDLVPRNAETEVKLADINAEFVAASPELAESLVGLRDPLAKLIDEMPALRRDVKKISRNMQRRQRAHDSGIQKSIGDVLAGIAGILSILNRKPPPEGSGAPAQPDNTPPRSSGSSVNVSESWRSRRLVTNRPPPLVDPRPMPKIEFEV